MNHDFNLWETGEFLNLKNGKRSKAGLNVASVSEHVHRNAEQVNGNSRQVQAHFNRRFLKDCYFNDHFKTLSKMSQLMLHFHRLQIQGSNLDYCSLQIGYYYTLSSVKS